MKKALFLSAIISLGITASSQAAIVLGDLAIVGYNADGTDDIWVLALNDISSSETFLFSDNGWQSSGSFRTGEGTRQYTFASAVSSGTIFQVTTANSSAISGSLDFSGSGDQVSLFTGSAGSPTFIYALNNDGAGIWQADATDTNTSALPTGLTNGTTAVALTEIDNAVFDFATYGSSKTASQWLAAIGNKDNWIGDNTNNQAPSVSSVTVIPEPSAAVLGLLGLGAAALRRRR